MDNDKRNNNNNNDIKLSVNELQQILRYIELSHSEIKFIDVANLYNALRAKIK